MPFEINHHSNPHSYVKQIGRARNNESTFNFKQLGTELVLGGFYEGPMTKTGFVGTVIIGFIPIAGQVADIRDITAAIKDLIESPNTLSAIGVGITLLCLIPGLDILVRAKRLQKVKIIEKTKIVPKAPNARSINTSYSNAFKKTWKDSKKASKRFVKQNRSTHYATGVELRERRPVLMKVLNSISETVGGGKMETLEHAWLKQRYVKEGSDNWISKNLSKHPWVKKQLKMYSNAGWNLYPMTRSLNSKLGQRPMLSLFVNGAVYHVAAQEVIYTIEALKRIEDNW